MLSVLAVGSVMSSSSHRRPRAIDATSKSGWRSVLLSHPT
jgi:hypothetical protein